VSDVNSEEIPEEIKLKKLKMDSDRGKPHYIVQFFDDADSW
jgi:hypothetical protein